MGRLGVKYLQTLNKITCLALALAITAPWARAGEPSDAVKKAAQTRAKLYDMQFEILSKHGHKMSEKQKRFLSRSVGRVAHAAMQSAVSQEVAENEKRLIQEDEAAVQAARGNSGKEPVVKTPVRKVAAMGTNGTSTKKTKGKKTKLSRKSKRGEKTEELVLDGSEIESEVVFGGKKDSAEESE